MTSLLKLGRTYGCMYIQNAFQGKKRIPGIHSPSPGNQMFPVFFFGKGHLQKLNYTYTNLCPYLGFKLSISHIYPVLIVFFPRCYEIDWRSRIISVTESYVVLDKPAGTSVRNWFFFFSFSFLFAFFLRKYILYHQKEPDALIVLSQSLCVF